MPKVSSYYIRIHTQGRLRHSSVSSHHDAQLMTESIIDDALLQAMPHIKHTLIQLFVVVVSGILDATFPNQML